MVIEVFYSDLGSLWIILNYYTHSHPPLLYSRSTKATCQIMYSYIRLHIFYLAISSHIYMCMVHAFQYVPQWITDLAWLHAYMNTSIEILAKCLVFVWYVDASTGSKHENLNENLPTQWYLYVCYIYIYVCVKQSVDVCSWSASFSERHKMSHHSHSFGTFDLLCIYMLVYCPPTHLRLHTECTVYGEYPRTHTYTSKCVKYCCWYHFFLLWLCSQHGNKLKVSNFSFCKMMFSTIWGGYFFSAMYICIYGCVST